jgi:hypothetical protein
MVVGRLEDLPEFPDLLWVVEIDIRIAKVEIQSGTEIKITRATVDFGQSVPPQRVHAAERHEACRELPDLVCGPVVLSFTCVYSSSTAGRFGFPNW